MDPFGAGAALHWLAPPCHISSAHRARKDGAGVRINVTSHQQKKKNQETTKGKSRAGKRKKVKTGDRFCRCCVLPSCGRSGGSTAKK